MGKKAGCPPQIPLLDSIFDLNNKCYVIINQFDLATHINKMKDRHPGYSWRQLVNCLYWQGTARKQLNLEIQKFKRTFSGMLVSTCPEAMGLNVTSTLKLAGIDIQWPPTTFTLQVAFAGYPSTIGENIKLLEKLTDMPG